MDSANKSLPNNSVSNKPLLKIKIPKKLVIFLGIVCLVTLGAILFYLFRQSRGLSEDTVVATVNQKPLYKKYITNELSFYPGEKPTDAAKLTELEKKIKAKIVDDEITLQEGKKRGIIKEYPKGSTLTPSEYLKRTDTVQKIKEKINESGDMIRGKTVMVWFYNNRHIGPGGIERSKLTAYAKIKPLYDQVKSGKITIEQAGEEIKKDTSLSLIDPAWKWNALSPFVYYRNKTATWWPEYNELLWNTKEGELTPLYLGGGILREGKPVEELYIFSQIDKKSTNKDYAEYQQWLEEKRKAYSIKYTITGLLQNLKFSKVFADDNPDNGSRSGNWYGRVTTRTGMPIAGATVVIQNGCNYPGRRDTTNGNGGYNTGTDYNLSCLCNPQKGWAEYQGYQCEVKDGIQIANGDASIEVNFTCDPPPTPTATPTPSRAPVCNMPCNAFECQGAWDGCTVCTPNPNGTRTCQPPPTPTPTRAPTPTPILTCGKTCSDATECAIGVDGCRYCLPNATGQRVCSPARACNQPCERPDDCQSAQGCGSCLADGTGRKTCQPPPACGTSCTDDTKCIGAPNGCTSCVPDNGGEKKCAPAPRCGDSCLRDDQCAGAKDGCTTCGESDTGSGKVCRPPAACGVACTKDSQCAGARDGCTFCTAGKCSAFNPDMCSCDGMDVFGPAGAGKSFFPGDKLTFIAYGKVPGKDWKGSDQAAIAAAQITSMQFSLYQSKLSDPNNAIRIAQSAAITPQIVETTSTKVRYKVTWDRQLPATVPSGTLFRIQATLKCSPKAGVLGVQTLGENNYFTQLFDSVSSLFAKGSVLAVTDIPQKRDEQQAKTFSVGAKIQEKSCTFIKFYFE